MGIEPYVVGSTQGLAKAIMLCRATDWTDCLGDFGLFLAPAVRSSLVGEAYERGAALGSSFSCFHRGFSMHSGFRVRRSRLGSFIESISIPVLFNQYRNSI